MRIILAQSRRLSIRTLACLLPLWLLAACGIIGDDDNNPNSPPTANAGADQLVLENSAVILTGSGSDPDPGDILIFAWTQIAGVIVTVNDATLARANFTPPDVAMGAPETLTFQLTVSDGALSRTDTVNIIVQEPQPVVSVFGVVGYEFVPPTAGCRDLNFGAITVQPIRGATVQLLGANTGGVLQSTTSSDTGDYAFAGVSANADVRLRVRAELKRSGSPNWDIEIRDNFLPGQSDFDMPPPPPEGSRALYVLDGNSFNTGGLDVNRDLTAGSGWGGSSYTAARAAAPFAILDAMYSGIQLIISADPGASFPAMDAFWSVNNTGRAVNPDITAGMLPTAFYSSGAMSLYLRGDTAQNTDEFDDHVVMHEWGHYFEDAFSRSDSVGGPHTLGESLDARLAWGEGMASAFGAMALNDPLQCDTAAVGSNGGFSFNMESTNSGLDPGWFNEISVAKLVYDLFDTNVDGTDTGTIGFVPIYDAMVGPLRVTPAFTTVHTFAAELRPMLDANGQALLDSQMERESINDPVESSVDIWASTENNDRNGARDALPLYTDYTAGDPAINICSNNDLDNEVGGNKLSEYRYLRINVPVTDTYNVVISATTIPTPTADVNDRDQSDPDMFILRDGQIVAFGLSGVDNVETFTTQNTLFAGVTYVADIHDWRFEDVESAPAGYPDTTNNNMCFDITFTATP